MENRWLRKLQEVKGSDGECGEFDLYVAMAVRYRWTPEQVNALDPQFLEELLAYQAADARHEEMKRKEAERKAAKNRR